MRLAIKLHYAVLLTALLLIGGCGSWITGKPEVKPQMDKPAQVEVMAYAQVDKVDIALRRMAMAKLADPSLPYTKAQLERAFNDAKVARTAIDAAQGSFAVGDLSTTIGKLNAAQAILDSLSAFLAAHPVP